MNVMQLMAGGDCGGAEAFFARLVSALHVEGVTQTAVIKNNSKRLGALQKVGVETHQLNYGSILDIYTPWRIKQLAKLKKPDIVMSWMNRASRMIPVGQWQRVGRLGGYYNLKYYKKCNYLICNTPDIRDYVIKQGWCENQAYYISNFVNEKTATPLPKSSFNTPANMLLIFTAGRLHENKGFDVLIKAIARLDDICLWIAGEGPLRDDLNNLVADLNLGSRVKFLGWREDINALLSSVDLFVCPSRHEPLGNVVLEAWAQKTPIIATAAQGPKQLIEEGENGLLVPIDDHLILAEKIVTLLHNKKLQENMIDNAHRKYQESFSQKIIVGQYKKFFNSILDK